MKTELKDWLKRRIGYKNKPKIVLRHRERRSGKWIKCECPCICTEPSRWVDGVCIPCFRGRHRNNYKERVVER